MKRRPHTRQAGVKEVKETERRISAVASTEEIDSWGTVLKASGWDLTRFNANPVLLFAHDGYSRTPVGHCENVRAEGSELLFDAVFDDTSPFDEEVYQKYVKKVMRGFSVRFEPVESCIEKRNGVDVIVYTKQILMEISCAPVPANAGALRRTDGGKRTMKRSETMKALRELTEGDGDEDEKKAAGELYKAMGGEDGEKTAREAEEEGDKDEEDPPSSKKGKEEPRAAKKAPPSSPPVRTAARSPGAIDLAIRLATLESAEQRRAVLALVEKYADRFTPTTRAWALGDGTDENPGEPLDTVQRYVRKAPKLDLRAPASTPATRGQEQGKDKPLVSELPEAEGEKLDRIMGINKPASAIGFASFDPNSGAKPFRTAGAEDIEKIQGARRALQKAG